MKKMLFVITIVFFSLILAGCNMNPFNAMQGGTTNEKIWYEKDSAKKLEINLDVGVGEIILTGGSEEWVTGELEYSKKNVKVDHKYKLAGDVGKFHMEQKEKGTWKIFNRSNDWKNRWEIQLNDEIPVDLKVDAGVSDSKIDLRDVQLSSLDFDGGVGKVEMDLSGQYTQSFEGKISTGVGETTIILPNDIGVKVTFESGIGSTNFEGFLSLGNNEYVNLSYDTADVLIHLHVKTGVGETTFKLR